MTNAEVRQYLGQVLECEREIRRYKERLYELRVQAGGVGAIRYDKDKVVTSPDNMMEKAIIRACEVEERIEQKIAEKTIKQVNLTEQIEAVGGNEAEILYQRFVNMKSFGQIAREENYSNQYIRNLLVKALKNFGNLYKNEIEEFSRKPQDVTKCDI